MTNPTGTFQTSESGSAGAFTSSIPLSFPPVARPRLIRIPTGADHRIT